MIGRTATRMDRIKTDPRVRSVMDRMENVPVLSKIAERMAPPESTAKRFVKRAWPFVATSGATFGVAYFFDRDRGRGRRAMAKDRIAGAARRTMRKTRRAGRLAASDAAGMRERWRHRSDGRRTLDDVTLVNKVSSEVFGDRSLDASRLNLNAEYGIVTVRGAVDSPADIDRLERRIRAVNGVSDVRMLVHLKNAPAHWKEASVEASREAAGELRRQRA